MGVSWGAVQNLVAPGGVGQVGEVAGRGHGTRAYPGTSTESGEIEILADRGASGWHQVAWGSVEGAACGRGTRACPGTFFYW